MSLIILISIFTLAGAMVGFIFFFCGMGGAYLDMALTSTVPCIWSTTFLLVQDGLMDAMNANFVSVGATALIFMVFAIRYLSGYYDFHKTNRY